MRGVRADSRGAAEAPNHLELRNLLAFLLALRQACPGARDPPRSGPDRLRRVHRPRPAAPPHAPHQGRSAPRRPLLAGGAALRSGISGGLRDRDSGLARGHLSAARGLPDESGNRDRGPEPLDGARRRSSIQRCRAGGPELPQGGPRPLGHTMGGARGGSRGDPDALRAGPVLGDDRHSKRRLLLRPRRHLGRERERNLRRGGGQSGHESGHRGGETFRHHPSRRSGPGRESHPLRDEPGRGGADEGAHPGRGPVPDGLAAGAARLRGRRHLRGIAQGPGALVHGRGSLLRELHQIPRLSRAHQARRAERAGARVRHRAPHRARREIPALHRESGDQSFRARDPRQRGLGGALDLVQLRFRGRRLRVRRGGGGSKPVRGCPRLRRGDARRVARHRLRDFHGPHGSPPTRSRHHARRSARGFARHAPSSGAGGDPGAMGIFRDHPARQPRASDLVLRPGCARGHEALERGAERTQLQRDGPRLGRSRGIGARGRVEAG